VVLIIFALSIPANAQWGNSWGWRQPQQPYSPYGGGFGRDPQWDYWGYRQRERAPTRLRERPREVEKEQPPDYSHAPPATPRKDATVKVVVMGDANAVWLAYGLEEAFSEKPEIGIVRKHRTDSGLIRYEQRRDSESQVAREIIAVEKPKFIVMMVGNNDRQSIRETIPPPAPANAQPAQPAQPSPCGVSRTVRKPGTSQSSACQRMRWRASARRPSPQGAMSSMPNRSHSRV
jgi:hypothetical protein